MAPSALAYGPRNQVPRVMTRSDMDRARAGYKDMSWPNQYLMGRVHLERNLARA